MINLFTTLTGVSIPAPLDFIAILFVWCFAFVFVLEVLKLLFFWRK